MGLGAVNVGRAHAPASMIVGQAGGSRASRAFNEGEPPGRPEVAEVKGRIADWASTDSPLPSGRGAVSQRGVSSRPSTHPDSQQPPLKSMPGTVGAAWNIGAALVEAS